MHAGVKELQALVDPLGNLGAGYSLLLLDDLEVDTLCHFHSPPCRLACPSLQLPLQDQSRFQSLRFSDRYPDPISLRLILLPCTLRRLFVDR